LAEHPAQEPLLLLEADDVFNRLAQACFEQPGPGLAAGGQHGADLLQGQSGLAEMADTLQAPLVRIGVVAIAGAGSSAGLQQSEAVVVEQGAAGEAARPGEW